MILYNLKNLFLTYVTLNIFDKNSYISSKITKQATSQSKYISRRQSYSHPISGYKSNNIKPPAAEVCYLKNISFFKNIQILLLSSIIIGKKEKINLFMARN
jgi:hypothetical protein